MCLSTLAAEAQPTLTASTTAVTPGATVTLTITGIPGQNFAVLGSSVGAGLSYGGVNLGVDADRKGRPGSRGASGPQSMQATCARP